MAGVFPLSHLVQAFTACFNPHTTGSGFSGGGLLSIAVWGLAGAYVAVRRFAREATDEDSRRLRRHHRVSAGVSSEG